MKAHRGSSARWPRHMIAAVGMAAVVLVAGCDGGTAKTKTVSRADFGDEWPLTIDSGTLECRNGAEVVISANGTVYALNGTAKSGGAYASVDPIWADDPGIPGLKVDIGPLVNEGLTLC